MWVFLLAFCLLLASPAISQAIARDSILFSISLRCLTPPLRFCWSIVYVRCVCLQFHFILRSFDVLCFALMYALPCLAFVSFVLWYTRMRCVYCWVQVCNQYSILIVLCGERVCTHRIRHTWTHEHYTSYHICTPLYLDCSLHNYLTFFRLWCRFSLCFEFTCVCFGINNNNLRSFFMMAGKLHAFTRCMGRWSIIYYVF